MIPTKVIKLIERLCRSYIWSGVNAIAKKALVAWNKVSIPKAGGGLNLINLQLWKRAAIAETCWDLAYKQDKLWIRWIRTYYIKRQQEFTNLSIPQQACWMVKKIIEAKEVLENHLYEQTHKKILFRQIYLSLLGDYNRFE